MYNSYFAFYIYLVQDTGISSSDLENRLLYLQVYVIVTIVIIDFIRCQRHCINPYLTNVVVILKFFVDFVLLLLDIHRTVKQRPQTNEVLSSVKIKVQFQTLVG